MQLVYDLHLTRRDGRWEVDAVGTPTAPRSGTAGGDGRSVIDHERELTMFNVLTDLANEAKLFIITATGVVWLGATLAMGLLAAVVPDGRRDLHRRRLPDVGHGELGLGSRPRRRGHPGDRGTGGRRDRGVMDVDLDLIDCACYTSARRHPEVLGRIGRTVLPFQLTAPALVTGVVDVPRCCCGHGRRGGTRCCPALPAAMIVLGVPLALGRLAMVTSLGGRSPFLTALGVVRYLFRCRSGLVAGRPVRRPPRRRLRGRMVVEHRS